MNFKGKVVIITGAARGIGRHMAGWFAERGASIAVVDILQEEGLAVSRKITDFGGDAMFVNTDVASSESVDELMLEVDKRWGSCDVLVNNAAISVGGSFLETSLEKWKRTIDINLTGAFLVGQKTALYMVAKGTAGRIVNMVSTNSFTSERGACPYAASKGGLHMLTKSMAVDLAPYGIAVNAVAPGPILTETNEEWFQRAPFRDVLAKAVPSGGPGRPEDVAEAVGFLASGDCRFVNGTTLVVDGGFLAYARLD